MLGNLKSKLRTISLTDSPKDKKKKLKKTFFKSKKSLMVRKMTQSEKLNEYINKQIYDCFNSPEKFLSPESPITVGKKVKFKNFKSLLPIDSFTKKPIISKRMSTFNRKSIFTDLSHRSLSSNMLFKDKNSVNNDLYEIVDNERLKKIFESFKLKKNNENEVGKKTSYKLPLTLIQSLNHQNNSLKFQKNFDKLNHNLSKRLSKTIGKNEQDLLLNKIDDYTFKKELLKEMDFSKTINEKYSKFNWNISLRRPKKFKGTRNSYINLSNNDHPFWAIIVEKYPKIKEIQIKPGNLLKNKNYLEEFKKSHFSFKNINNQFKSLDNLDTLNIKGKKLFDIEYKREIIDNKKKKILHKVFDYNGKTFSSADINNVFGEKIFIKNYKGLMVYENKNKNKVNENSKYYSTSSAGIKSAETISVDINQDKAFSRNSSENYLVKTYTNTKLENFN